MEQLNGLTIIVGSVALGALLAALIDSWQQTASIRKSTKLYLEKVTAANAEGK